MLRLKKDLRVDLSRVQSFRGRINGAHRIRRSRACIGHCRFLNLYHAHRRRFTHHQITFTTPMKPVILLMFSGSARRESFNQRLVEAAAAKANALGAEVDVVNLADYPMPLFNQDLEAESFPDAVSKLRDKMIAVDGILLACPEYNGSISPLLKNTIDWLSRPQDGVADRLVAYRGMVAALVAASPGRLGGMGGLVHVRAILSGIGVTVIPEDLALGSAYQAFDESGDLVEDPMDQRLTNVVKGLIRTAKALSHEES